MISDEGMNKVFLEGVLALCSCRHQTENCPSRSALLRAGGFFDHIESLSGV